MRRTTRQRVIAVGLAVLASGCTTMPRAAEVVTGAVVGVAGGVTCALLGGSARTCAAVGAGVAVAAVAGQVISRQLRSAQEEAAYRGYAPSSGIQALTDAGRAVPDRVQPGETLQVTVGRSVLTPDFRAAVAAEEVWELWAEGFDEPIAEIDREEHMLEPGYFEVTRTFRVPEAEPGCYRIAYWLEAEGVSSNKAFVPFQVGDGAECGTAS